jgi:hypothetical protein
VKVTEVDGTAVRAVQATLQDALEQGEFWERGLLPDELRASRSSPPASQWPRGRQVAGAPPSSLRRVISLPGELTLRSSPSTA